MNRVRRDTPEFRKWERIWIKRDRVELVGRRVLAGRTTNEISATGSRRSRLEGKFVLMEERRDLGDAILGLALIFEFIDRSLTLQRYSKRRKRNVSSGTKR